ncbi:hypothetical protein ACFX2J_018426 [Malus domestica]
MSNKNLSIKRKLIGAGPQLVDSAQLASIFESVGNVQMVKVIYDKTTARSRGFGFVAMSSVQEVESAARQLNDYALVTILSWLARNGFAPTDNVVVSLAKSIIEPHVTKEEDIVGCSFLLNMLDAVSGVEVIEEQLRTRKDYQEVSSIMNVGMTYSLLYSSAFECEDPTQRRELLLRKFKEKHTGEIGKFDKVQSTFWREWKLKLEDQKRVADRCTTFEKIIPGVDTDVLTLADEYHLNRSQIFLCYLSSVIVSEVWTNDDITCEISEFKGEIVGYAVETIKAVSYIVYPAIDGCHKVRLAYIFGLLSVRSDSAIVVES